MKGAKLSSKKRSELRDFQDEVYMAMGLNEVWVSRSNLQINPLELKCDGEHVYYLNRCIGYIDGDAVMLIFNQDKSNGYDSEGYIEGSGRPDLKILARKAKV